MSSYLDKYDFTADQFEYLPNGEETSNGNCDQMNYWDYDRNNNYNNNYNQSQQTNNNNINNIHSINNVNNINNTNFVNNMNNVNNVNPQNMTTMNNMNYSNQQRMSNSNNNAFNTDTNNQWKEDQDIPCRPTLSRCHSNINPKLTEMTNNYPVNYQYNQYHPNPVQGLQDPLTAQRLTLSKPVGSNSNASSSHFNHSNTSNDTFFSSNNSNQYHNNSNSPYSSYSTLPPLPMTNHCNSNNYPPPLPQQTPSQSHNNNFALQQTYTVQQQQQNNNSPMNICDSTTYSTCNSYNACNSCNNCQGQQSQVTFNNGVANNCQQQQLQHGQVTSNHSNYNQPYQHSSQPSNFGTNDGRQHHGQQYNNNNGADYGNNNGANYGHNHGFHHNNCSQSCCTSNSYHAPNSHLTTTSTLRTRTETVVNSTDHYQFATNRRQQYQGAVGSQSILVSPPMPSNQRDSKTVHGFNGHNNHNLNRHFTHNLQSVPTNSSIFPSQVVNVSNNSANNNYNQSAPRNPWSQQLQQQQQQQHQTQNQPQYQSMNQNVQQNMNQNVNQTMNTNHNMNHNVSHNMSGNNIQQKKSQNVTMNASPNPKQVVYEQQHHDSSMSPFKKDLLKTDGPPINVNMIGKTDDLKHNPLTKKEKKLSKAPLLRANTAKNTTKMVKKKRNRTKPIPLLEPMNSKSSVSSEPAKKKQKVNKSLAYNKKLDGYECKECGKVYKYICNLRSHSKIHTDAAHICEFCHKRFGRKANYIEHKRIHTGEEPFKCSLCKKGFKQRHGWKDHMKIHNRSNRKE